MAISENTPSRGRFDPVREQAFGDINPTLTMIGPVFEASFYILYIQNFTDVVIDFSVSFAGEDVTVSLAAGGAFSTDMLTNDVVVAKGEAAWCRYRDGAPSSGFVQVSAVIPTNF